MSQPTPGSDPNYPQGGAPQGQPGWGAPQNQPQGYGAPQGYNAPGAPSGYGNAVARPARSPRPPSSASSSVVWARCSG